MTPLTLTEGRGQLIIHRGILGAAEPPESRTKRLAGAGLRVEPPIGIEPMTYASRVACCLPAHALPAPIARIIALTAPTTLGLSGRPFHEPFHGCGAAD
jgi:hypothetical protein